MNKELKFLLDSDKPIIYIFSVIGENNKENKNISITWDSKIGYFIFSSDQVIRFRSESVDIQDIITFEDFLNLLELRRLPFLKKSLSLIGSKMFISKNKLEIDQFVFLKKNGTFVMMDYIFNNKVLYLKRENSTTLYKITIEEIFNQLENATSQDKDLLRLQERIPQTF